MNIQVYTTNCVFLASRIHMHNIWLFRLFGETGSSMVPWSRSELAREKDAAKFPS